MKLSNVRITPNEKLIFKTKYGLTANENEQPEMISKYFENSFYRNAVQMTINNDNITYINRSKKSSIGFKNNESPGMNQINLFQANVPPLYPLKMSMTSF